jgi:hypothetical protein
MGERITRMAAHAGVDKWYAWLQADKEALRCVYS